MSFPCGHVARAETVVERCGRPRPEPLCMLDFVLQSEGSCPACLERDITRLEAAARTHTRWMRAIYRSNLRQPPSQAMLRDFEEFDRRFIAINRRIALILNNRDRAIRTVEQLAERAVPRERRRSPERMEAAVAPPHRPQGWARRGAFSAPDGHPLYNTAPASASRDGPDDENEEL